MPGLSGNGLKIGQLFFIFQLIMRGSTKEFFIKTKVIIVLPGGVPLD